jgi:hypothetical protein
MDRNPSGIGRSYLDRHLNPESGFILGSCPELSPLIPRCRKIPTFLHRLQNGECKRDGKYWLGFKIRAGIFFLKKHLI